MKMEEDPKNHLEQTDEEFSFLQETIKKEPIRKWLIKKAIQFSVAGLLLGIFATMAYYALSPWVSEQFRARPEKVTIPEDKEPEVAVSEEEAETVNAPEIVEESYEDRMKAMLDASETAKRCTVVVSTKTESAQTESDEDTDLHTASGVIVADNGLELLILVSNSICENNQWWEIQFVDGKIYPATMVKQDRITGLAVLAVSRDTIDEETLEMAEIAVLGNSGLMVEGKTVIAYGNIFNPESEVNNGSIRSTESDMYLADGRYGILGTDVTMLQDGTGVLFNIDGEVVGLVMPGFWSESDTLLANAFAISDLKPIIERLSNAESVPYAGIHGATVDEETSEEQGLPKGMYVRQVDADSPAMNAGIQNGDVLTEIGNTTITSVDIYQRALKRLHFGDQIRLRGQRRGTDGYVEVEYMVTVGSFE